MPVTSPLRIVYGNREVGGASASYQLAAPYVFDRSSTEFRLVFDVLVVGANLQDLQSKAAALERDMSLRLESGQTFLIEMPGGTWTYTAGADVLNVQASIAKSGNPQTDFGAARIYTCSISGGMAMTQNGGLQDCEVIVEHNPNRQRVVTMRGVYTATSSANALGMYQSNGDGVASAYLAAIGGGSFELVDESYSCDRERVGAQPNPHVCRWTRQYQEVITNQAASLNDPAIVDPRISFSRVAPAPGDSKENVWRLRRVVASYDCAVSKEVTTDLLGVYEGKIKPLLRSTFTAEFDPQQWAVEDSRVSFDNATNRVSVSMTFVYQPGSGREILEVKQSCTLRETRQIDYTPVHGEDELAYVADPGWLVVERIWQRVVMVMGVESPHYRLAEAVRAGPARQFDDRIGDQSGPDGGGRGATSVQEEGWNTIANTSQVEHAYLGQPGEGAQIETTILTETIVQRYTRKPAGSTSGGIPR